MNKLLCLIFFLTCCTLLSAHPASQITAEFSHADSTLRITYLHSVKSPAEHYISEVNISLNGIEIIKQNLSLQASPKGGSLAYKIPDAKAKDTIEIKTTCSKIGTKSLKYTIHSIPDH